MTETATTETPIATTETKSETLLTVDPVVTEQPANTEQPAPVEAQGAPEKYEFASPEGSSVDPVVLQRYAEVARELNLPQDQAQKVIDKIAPALAERQAEQIQAAHTAWIESTHSDKEIGGQELQANLSIAQKALTQFGSPELKTLLDQSGLGNHPEIIRLLVRAGKSISEEVIVTGRETNNIDALAKLYPSKK